MPVITGKKLIGLPVETNSGKLLGKIFDFELEIDSQHILRYYVKGGSIFKELFVDELIIHYSQVIFIDDKKMIVSDGIVKEKSIKRSEVVAAA